MKNTIVRVALGTGLLLLIPALLQLTIGTGVDGQGFNWKPGDFLVAGVLLFGTGLLLDLVYRKTGKYRLFALSAVVLAFLWLWAELAVGIFTDWGS